MKKCDEYSDMKQRIMAKAYALHPKFLVLFTRQDASFPDI